MTLSEKYWLTVLLAFCRYISILMIGGGTPFFLLGYYINKWFYLGLTIWPLLIMWGIINFRFIRVLEKAYKVELSKISIEK